MSEERRNQKRYPVLDQFSIFVTVDGLGPQRHRLKDFSSEGLGLELEVSEEMKVAVGAHLRISVYLNQSLSIPLRSVVVWLRGQTVGLEIQKEDTKAFHAYQNLIAMLAQWPLD